MNGKEKAERWYTKLHWQVALGLVVGVTLGISLGEGAVPWYEWVGEVFLRLLKMVVVPLVFASITVGVIRLGSPKEVGRLGGVTLLYYLATSCLAIGVGLLVVNVFSPGVGLELSLLSSAGEIKQGSLTAHDLLMKWIPDNPLRTFTLFGTEEAGAGYAMLGIIFFGIVFGLATSATGGKHAARLEGVLDAVFEVMMTMTRVIIRMAPAGYESVAAIFIANLYGIHLGVSGQILVFVTALRETI